jgi:hypothetical protein
LFNIQIESENLNNRPACAARNGDIVCTSEASYQFVPSTSCRRPIPEITASPAVPPRNST